MLIGLCVTAICLPICIVMWWGTTADVLPWLFEQSNLQGLFTCIGSTYLPILPYAFSEVCYRKGIWSNPPTRLIGGFLIGATLGIFESARASIYGEHPGLSHFHTEGFSNILLGVSSIPESICVPARTLFQKAYVLAVVGNFLDCWTSCAFEFGTLALMAILLYDKVRYLLDRRKGDVQIAITHNTPNEIEDSEN